MIVCFSSDIISQDFNMLNDNTGFKLSYNELDSLKKYSQILSEEFAFYENESNFFKVYDSGIYLHNLDQIGSTQSAVDNIKAQIPSTQKSYLLFTKVLVNESDSLDLNIEFVFGDSEYSCLDTEFINALLNQLVSSSISRLSIFELEIEILKQLNTIISEGYCCSSYYSNTKQNKSSSSCVDLEAIDGAVLALSSDPRFEQMLFYIKLILEEHDPCGNWSSLGKHGIIPMCVWENAEVNPTSLFVGDLPFTSGLIDGASSEIYGIYNLLMSADEILKAVEKTTRYYTLYLLYCKDYHLSPLELEMVFDELLECDTWYNETAKVLYAEIYNDITLIRGGVGSAVLWLWDLDCENDLVPFGAIVDSYIYFATNSDSLEMFGNQIIASVDTIMSSIDLFDNTDRYYIGYYGFKTAFILAGVSKVAATMTVKLSKMASKVTGNVAKNLGKKIFSRMADDLLKSIKNDSWYKSLENKGLFDKCFHGNYKALKYIRNNPSDIQYWNVLSSLSKRLTSVENIKAIKAYESTIPNSLTKIKVILNDSKLIKSKRRQPFITGLGQVANNSSMQLSNSRLASPDEVAKAVNALRDFRKLNSGLPQTSNAAEFDGFINGSLLNNTNPRLISSNRTWVSGLDNTPLNVPHVWKAQNAPGSNGGSWFRDLDAEYKMLNDLARKLAVNATEGNVITTFSGELFIISEIPYCSSCAGIIQKFNSMFPNIKIILIDGVK